LPRIIETLRARGYHFVTIPQMALTCGPGATSVRQAVVSVLGLDWEIAADRPRQFLT
jgi:hypothetical protein